MRNEKQTNHRQCVLYNVERFLIIFKRRRWKNIRTRAKEIRKSSE